MDASPSISDKSLISKPCDSNMLCGISTRFQVLSPSYGQVTHALLTRPPLSTLNFNRSLHSKLPARLACVRHAASVRPEPGSNSLVNCYIRCLHQIYFTQKFQLIFSARLFFRLCPSSYLSIRELLLLCLVSYLQGSACLFNSHIPKS